MNNKLGIGYITCDSLERVEQTFKTIPKNLGEVVVINSGCTIPESKFEGATKVIQSSRKQTVATSKNKALRYLMSQDCDHIFLIEDDVKVVDPNVFAKYVKSAQESGIWHLNYALQKSFDKPPPEPRAKYSYGSTKLSFYQYPTGAFQYFYRGIIKNVGYFDERYMNAFENVDYLYRVIKKGLHPPFWWFADIDHSDLYLENLEDCSTNSVLRTDPDYGNNLMYAKAWFKDKYGITPELVPDTLEDITLKKVQNIKNKYAKELIK